LGTSDGNEGVQWNSSYRPGDGFVWLGVNLEGMGYDDWPVARRIERRAHLGGAIRALLGRLLTISFHPPPGPPRGEEHGPTAPRSTRLSWTQNQ